MHTRACMDVSVHVCVHACVCVGDAQRQELWDSRERPHLTSQSPLPHAQRALSHRGTPDPYFLPCSGA